ncbi:MAG: GGDEF domain-containing protein, partial [Thiohalomonadales bacterium]
MISQETAGITMALAAKQQENWKQKYLDYLDETETKEKLWRTQEKLLKHCLNRVALAADGIDNELDVQLKSLRKSLRTESGQDKAYQDIQYIVDNITHTVKRLDERSAADDDTYTPLGSLTWLVNHVELPKHFQKKTRKLKKNLASLDKKDSVQTELESYCAILNSTFATLQMDSRTWLQKVFGDKDDIAIDFDAPASEQEPANREQDVSEAAYHTVSSNVLDQLMQKLPSHWLNNSQSTQLRERLENIKSKQAVTSILDDIVSSLQAVTELSGAQQKDDSQKSEHSKTVPAADTQQQLVIINKFCLKLLETMSFPLDLQAPALALRDRIIDGIGEMEIPGIIKAIADLLIGTRKLIEFEKRDLHEFLLQLTNHLEVIEGNLGGIVDISVDSGHSHEQFNQHLSKEMQELQQSVLQADTLDLLKQDVNERVNAIQTHISENQLSLFERQKKLQDALNLSSVRLKKLEKEGDTLRERLQQEHAQATHDALTGLYNRLAYEQHVHMEFARWKRYKKPLSMLIFDIDHFKNINDTYGHKAGDNALRLIAKKLNSNVRETDFIARYGGEEFVVLMPETSLEDAMAVAEKLRLCVEEVKFNFQNKPVPITISCGGAEFIE